MPTDDNIRGFPSPYRTGRFRSGYGHPVFRQSHRVPAPPRPDLPNALNDLLSATAGVVTEKWDHYAAWIIAAFAAVAGLSVSNFDKAVELTSRTTVIGVLAMFIVAVLLNAWQKWRTIRAQAMIAGRKAGQDLKLQLTDPERDEFFELMKAAYPAYIAWWVGHALDRARAGGPAYQGKYLMRLSVGATTLGFAQLGLGVIAAGWIATALVTSDKPAAAKAAEVGQPTTTAAPVVASPAVQLELKPQTPPASAPQSRP